MERSGCAAIRARETADLRRARVAQQSRSPGKRVSIEARQGHRERHGLTVRSGRASGDLKMTSARALLRTGGFCIALAAIAGPAGAGASAAADPFAGPLPDLEAATPAPEEVAGDPLTLDTTIRHICADPRGRAALDRDMPGLRKNPNYFLFAGFSLRQLAGMSGGRITQDKLESLRLDLAGTSSGQVDQAGTH